MISKATEDDITPLNILVNSAYRGESSRQGWTTEADLLDGIRTDEEALREVLRDSASRILKYTEEGKILACVHLKKDGERLHLGMLTVSPELQGKGIGKLLLRAAEDEARAQLCNAIYMHVISVRHELIDWYVRHGYADTGGREDFPHGNPRFGIPKRRLEFVVLEKTLKIS